MSKSQKGCTDLTEESLEKTICSIKKYRDELDLKESIEKELGFAPLPAAGFRIAVKIYVRPEDSHKIKGEDGTVTLDADGKPMHILLPSVVTDNDKWDSLVGKVISKGPECYSRNPNHWCQVGDWVVIPGNSGHPFKYREIPVRIINDDNVLAVIPDPSYVTRC